MAVLEVLPEVVGAEELLCLITLPKLVILTSVVAALCPVCGIGEFCTAEATNVAGPIVRR